MKILLIVFFCLFLFTKYSDAQIPESENASDILLGMKKLNVLGSVLYIAAHPDDEATAISRQDALDLQAFVYAIAEYIYDLADRYEEFKARRHLRPRFRKS